MQYESGTNGVFCRTIPDRSGRGPSLDGRDHWVALSGVSPGAHSLHCKIVILDQAGIDANADTIAALMGFSRGDKIRPYVAELVAIGALEVHRVGMPARNTYRPIVDPPVGYAGPITAEDWKRAQRTGVYYLQRDDQAVKIGHTDSPIGLRIRNLSQDYGRLTLLAIEPGPPDLETRRHRQFWTMHIPSDGRPGGTEWFRPDGVLARHIADVARSEVVA